MISEYILNLLENDERVDGRKLDEFRDIIIEKNIIKKAEGSARVKMGKTDVIVGIKMDMGEPFPDTPNEGVLRTGAEFSPIAHSEFESGPPGEDSVELARVVDRGIRESKCIDLEKLCLKNGERVWTLSVDIHTINHDGNLIDASALASIVALLNTQIPKIEDNKIIRDKFSGKLPVTKKPITVTVGKIGDKILVDSIYDEEAMLENKLSVAFTEKDYICAMQKTGHKGLKESEIDEMINLALKKSREIRKLL